MRHLKTSLALGLILALASAPSLAADQSVQATPNNTFSPRTVTVNVGDTVTWTNGGGLHNVKFDDGSFEEPSEPSFSSWSVKRTFDAAGEFRYFCEEHGAAGGSGMSGTVVVQGAQPPPPPPGGTGDTTPPDIDDLRVVPSRFCNRKTSKCKRTGARIRFSIDEDASVSGRIVRRRDNKRVGKLSITAEAGENSLAFSGKGLALGRYRLELTPRDAAGNKASKPTRANFTVATSR
ncbi:MAG: plastocyanin/azurin family copper-binding protein [Actinomycetota bacterium]|nr:plastocyanin/azurin family copper-binding protein [Actinomycetota bacterium]